MQLQVAELALHLLHLFLLFPFLHICYIGWLQEGWTGESDAFVGVEGGFQQVPLLQREQVRQEGRVPLQG